MERGEPPKRKTPLKRSTTPIKRTELKRSNRPVAKKRTKPRRNHGTEMWPDFETGKDQVKHRSDMRCEANIVCRNGAHENTHHRKRREFGDHRPINLLGVCFACHDWIHDHPLEAALHGFIVWSWQDPRQVPVTPWVIDP